MGKFPPPIYSESEVPQYVLPELGPAEETRALFADHIYGRFPLETPRVLVEVVEKGVAALAMLARRWQLRVVLTGEKARVEFGLLLYTPVATVGAAPVFLGLNFFGNHTLNPDPAILLPNSWCRADETKGVVNNRATEAGRGCNAKRVPLEEIIARGYGFATVFCGDIAPDDPDHIEEGVLAFYPREMPGAPADSRGGAISAWAWGLSRAMDALVTLPDVDADRVIAIGHSRMGKAALWAGACDERFALVISNDSGCTGAALSRRLYGERIAKTNESFPHWYAKKYRSYNEREHELPVDQHQLIALIAPRAVYVASAVEDRWADPRGEYLGLAAAAPAWGEKLPAESPETDALLHRKKIAYHARSGGHDITPYDWSQYMTFADGLWRV